MSTPDPRRVADDAISVAAHLEGELEEALAEHRLTRASFLVLDVLEQARSRRSASATSSPRSGAPRARSRSGSAGSSARR